MEINPNHSSAQYHDICIQQLTNNNCSSSSREKVSTTEEEKKERALCYFLVCEEEEFGFQQIDLFLQQHADALEFLAMAELSSQGEGHS